MQNQCCTVPPTQPNYWRSVARINQTVTTFRHTLKPVFLKIKGIGSFEKDQNIAEILAKPIPID